MKEINEVHGYVDVVCVYIVIIQVVVASISSDKT